MTLKHLAIPLCVAFLAFGCADSGTDEDDTNSGDGDGDGDGAGDGDGDGDGDGTGDGDGDGDGTGDGDGDGDGTAPVATLSGRVCDDNGDPLPTAGVQLCTTDNLTCLTPPPDQPTDDGEWEIAVTMENNWALKLVHGPDGDQHYSGQARNIDINEGDDIEIDGCLAVPFVGDVEDLSSGDPAMVDIDILTFDVDPTEVEFNFSALSMLGGKRIDPSHYPIPVGDGGGTAIAIWAFAPFGAHPPEDSEYTIPVTFNAADPELVEPADGADIHFYEMNKTTGLVTEVATGTIDGDGNITADLSLHSISWLIASNEG